MKRKEKEKNHRQTRRRIYFYIYKMHICRIQRFVVVVIVRAGKNANVKEKNHLRKMKKRKKKHTQEIQKRKATMKSFKTMTRALFLFE